MGTTMTRMFVNAKVRATKLREARLNGDAGQGTLEYLGIVVVAAILILALIGVFNGGTFDLGKLVGDQLKKITDAIP